MPALNPHPTPMGTPDPYAPHVGEVPPCDVDLLHDARELKSAALDRHAVEHPTVTLIACPDPVCEAAFRMRDL